MHLGQHSGSVLGFTWAPAVQRGFRACVAAVLLLLAVSQAVADDAMVVNVNRADAQTMADALVGVGLSRAEAIVAYREANGDFTDPYELTAVKGIGERTIERNEGRIRLRD